MEFERYLYENGHEAVGLLMTYRCNLDCKYCYIKKKRNKDMTLEMAQAILESFLLKDSGWLDITLMGGETLLAMEVIRPLVEWAEERKWNRKYRFFGSTNGTLLDEELKEWLKNYSQVLTLGLSYDGLPSSQSDNRGNDEIDLDFFIQTWPRQPIQMTINTETVGRMADGIIYLLEKGAVVHPNVAYESEEWPVAKIAEYGRQLNKLITYYSTHEEMPMISQFVHDLNEYAENIDSPKEQAKICGVGEGFQVFDVDGQTYPCHILSPLVFEGVKLQELKNGLTEKTEDFSDVNCDGCPYISSCPTCMACNYLYRNNLQHRDKTHCRIMKMEVKSFIKKEVLRLKTKKQLTPEDAKEIDSIVKLVRYNKRHSHSI